MIFLHRGSHRAYHAAEDRLSLTELHRLRALVDRELVTRQKPPPARKDEPDAA